MYANSHINNVIRVCKCNDKDFIENMYDLENETLEYVLALFWLGRFGVENRNELFTNKSKRAEESDDIYENDEDEIEEINLDEEWIAFLKSAASQIDSGSADYILSKRDSQLILKIGLGLQGYAYSSELYQNLDLFNHER